MTTLVGFGMEPIQPSMTFAEGVNQCRVSLVPMGGADAAPQSSMTSPPVVRIHSQEVAPPNGDVPHLTPPSSGDASGSVSDGDGNPSS